MGTVVASGILLAGVFDGQYFYDVGSDTIDKHVVGGDEGFPRLRDATGAIHVRMIGQASGGIFQQFCKASSSGWIAIRDIVDDAPSILARDRAPDDVRHQACLAFFASMIARSSAMT